MVFAVGKMDNMLKKIPVINQTQASRELKEGSILAIDCSDSSYRLLNSTGSFLWKHIDGKRSVEELLAKLISEFSVDKETAIRDIQHFLDTMINKEMLLWQN